MATTDLVLTDDTIHVLDHGFVRLDDVMASDLSVVNAARVSFARRKEGRNGTLLFGMQPIRLTSGRR